MTAAVPRGEVEAFERDLDAMRGGLLPQYLANEGAPDVSRWESSPLPYWVLRATTDAGVSVWKAGSGSERILGHTKQ
jgi:hypothetical protein